MSWLTSLLGVLGGLFSWLNKRSDLANSPEMIARKKAQDEQAATDRIENLTKTAMTDPDPAKRKAAAEELRKLDSE